MYHYKFEHGEYSDHSEYWYAHELQFSETGIVVHLLKFWPEVKSGARARLAAKKAAALRLFGTEDPSWNYKGGKRVLDSPKGTAEEHDAWRNEFPYESGFSLFMRLIEAAGFREADVEVAMDIPDRFGVEEAISDLEDKFGG